MNLILSIVTACIVFASLVKHQDWIGLIAFIVMVKVSGSALITVGRELQSVSEWLEG